MSDTKYRFIVEWHDRCMGVKRRFILGFYPSDSSVDMYEFASKRIFLRRVKCDTLTLADLFVGGVVNVLSRQLFVVDYCDKTTSEKFTAEVESTFLIVNEDGFGNLGKIITVLEKNLLFINRGKIIEKDKSGFGSSSFAKTLQKKFIVFELRGRNAKHIVRKLLNPEAPIEKPLTVDLNGLSEFCIGPRDTNTVDVELNIFFSAKDDYCNTTTFRKSTCCIIKPHAVRERIVGQIIHDIVSVGFEISALKVVTFNNSSASEFYEVYKGVVEEYQGMVAQLISGPAIALEITKQTSKNVFIVFRTHCGPIDPDIARKLRPGTLRASYGRDKVKNAVHCTDLPEDTTVELNYIFKIMA